MTAPTPRLRGIVPSLVVALLALLALLMFDLLTPSPQRCWKVPDMVTVPVWIEGDREDVPRVCEDTMPHTVRDGSSRPMCWEMVLARGEECRR